MATPPRRHLPLEGAYNVRDLGGYSTVDGRTTRWKTLLRADRLDRLAPASQRALADYGIKTVIDLRRTKEVVETPDALADSPEFAYHHRNMAGDLIPEDESAVPIETRVGAEYWTANYTTRLDRRRGQIVEVLTMLSSPGTLPALFHCAAGKDRTGVMAALLLSLAGVPAETIAEDYALSARYLVTGFFEEEILPGLVPRGYTWRDYQLDHCPPEAMLGTLRYLEERHGGVEAYALGGGMTREQLEGLRTALVE